MGDTTPTVAEGAWVAPTAVLVGDARVQACASIWYGSVVRADRTQIVLGENSNLQDNCVVHGDPGYPVTIGAGVSVGHGAVIHGCTIEDQCLIGMSATVMNGARIGRGSIVAAGAVVLPGTHVPPGSLVAGVPGRVRRTTTEDDRREIVANANHYLDLAAEHARVRSVVPTLTERPSRDAQQFVPRAEGP
ncbi:gamma carbonic anhydrase family protein [Nocardioides sp. AN3]